MWLRPSDLTSKYRNERRKKKTLKAVKLVFFLKFLKGYLFDAAKVKEIEESETVKINEIVGSLSAIHEHDT